MGRSGSRASAAPSAAAPEQQGGGLRREPAWDLTDRLNRTKLMNAEDSVEAQVMLLRMRAILKKFYARLYRRVALERILTRWIARSLAQVMEAIAGHERAHARELELEQALGFRRRPLGSRRRAIGRVISLLLVLGEAGLAFAAAYALLPRLALGYLLGLALKVAPFLFALAVCGAAYGAIETAAVALAEALQRDHATVGEFGKQQEVPTGAAAPDDLGALWNPVVSDNHGGPAEAAPILLIYIGPGLDLLKPLRPSAAAA